MKGCMDVGWIDWLLLRDPQTKPQFLNAWPEQADPILARDYLRKLRTNVTSTNTEHHDLILPVGSGRHPSFAVLVIVFLEEGIILFNCAL